MLPNFVKVDCCFYVAINDIIELIQANLASSGSVTH